MAKQLKELLGLAIRSNRRFRRDISELHVKVLLDDGSGYSKTVDYGLNLNDLDATGKAAAIRLWKHVKDIIETQEGSDPTPDPIIRDP